MVKWLQGINEDAFPNKQDFNKQQLHLYTLYFCLYTIFYTEITTNDNLIDKTYITMSTNTYGLGGTEVKLDANEAIQEIPQNKTLFVEKLTSDTPVKPEIVKGLTTIDDLFNLYKPQVNMEF